MTTAAFSSSDTAALERETEITNDPEVTYEQIWSANNSQKTLDWILKNGYKRVCLQFPDHYLQHSDAIATYIKEAVAENRPDFKTFILADTSYGSCCVDEIAAAHVDSDSMIHFGNACRSKVSRLPVYYCFPELAFNMQAFKEQTTVLSPSTQDHIVTVYLDIGHHQILDNSITDFIAILQLLNAKQLHIVAYCSDRFVVLSETGELTEEKSGDYTKEINELDDERICLFIGADNQRFFNISLSTKAAKWFVYDVTRESMEEKNPLTAKYIRKRYYYIEKCKDAQCLGLVVATLTSDGYLEVVKRMQTMAKARGIKTQIISVGRINPAKLANFLEIDCFVLIGCPFNNMFESRDFYKPIVSVFEAEMALNPAWHMRYPDSYVTDFKQILAGGSNFMEFNANDINPEDISLVTGRLRSSAANGNGVELADISDLSEQQQSLATQPRMEVMTSNTGLTFEDRTWQGLDPALGQTEPAKLQKGLSGIPVKYTHD